MKFLLPVLMLFLLMAPTHTQAASAVPILMYHSLGNNSRNQLILPPVKFEKQVSWLKKNGYQFLTSEDVKGWMSGTPLSSKSVWITFDDGYVDNYYFTYQILQKYGAKATIFVITDVIGKPGYLTWEQIIEMQRSSLIEIGSHTVHHLELDRVMEGALSRELKQSKQVLEGKLGLSITAFAYPIGRYNTRATEAVRTAGYSIAVTTKPGKAEKNQDIFKLHRIRINSDQSFKGFVNLIQD